MALSNIITKLFGNKFQRDLKEIVPYIKKIEKVEPSMQAPSDDTLRDRIQQLHDEINECAASERAEVAKLREGIKDLDVDAREGAWSKIDKIEKEILKKIEVKLDETLPMTFAIVKEIARRFANNEWITVTATQMDRDLSIDHDFVEIDGDKAIYHNRWATGGSEITWDIVHYKIQLIGGVILHKGKIAGMATGEGKTLIVTLPVLLNALPGNGVHMVMVNDYLTKRDSK